MDYDISNPYYALCLPKEVIEKNLNRIIKGMNKFLTMKKKKKGISLFMMTFSVFIEKGSLM